MLASSPPNLWRMFVYGTLKRGEPNHKLLTNKSNGFQEFIGRAKIKTSYPLVIASRFNIPFLLDKSGIGESVRGEVYMVDKEMLGHLDILEEHPKLYKRREEPVIMEEDGQEVLCWIYFLPEYKPEMLELPHLSDYSCLANTDKPYVPRAER